MGKRSQGQGQHPQRKQWTLATLGTQINLAMAGERVVLEGSMAVGRGAGTDPVDSGGSGVGLSLVGLLGQLGHASASACSSDLLLHPGRGEEGLKREVLSPAVELDLSRCFPSMLSSSVGPRPSLGLGSLQ